MYVLDSTFWLRWQGFRGDVSVYVDSVGQAVGFFGQKRGRMIVPMECIRRVLIGFEPSRSHLIYSTYLWHQGSRYPLSVRTVGTGSPYPCFVRHLVTELGRLDEKPSIDLGTTYPAGLGSLFVTHGILLFLSILLMFNELQNDRYSMLGLGRWGAAVFLPIAAAIAIDGWRTYRRWYRPRPLSKSELENFLPPSG